MRVLQPEASNAATRSSKSDFGEEARAVEVEVVMTLRL